MRLSWVRGLTGCDQASWQGRNGGGWVGCYEVTQKEFKEVLGFNPSTNSLGGNYPVESMTLAQAMRFCKELTDKDPLPAGWRYDLPSEPQWEFFARGTTATTNGAYFLKSKPPRGPESPQAVGILSPNNYGLYDVLGNLAELTTATDRGDEGVYHVKRGGGFRSTADTLSVAHQPQPKGPWQHRDPAQDTGFRVVLVPVSSP